MGRFAMLILVFASMAQAAEGVSPYLPKVGPPPLRFQPAPRSVALLKLPPLAMADPTPPVAVPPAQPTPAPSHLPAPTNAEEAAPDLWDMFGADSAIPTPDPPVTASPPQPAGTAPPAAPPPPAPPGPPPPPDPAGTAPPAEPPPLNVTPQMLVKFFNQQPGASNRTGVEFLAPPSFFKPAIPPGGSPSSTATYTTPK